MLVGAKAALDRLGDRRADPRSAWVAVTAVVGLVALFGLARAGAPEVVARRSRGWSSRCRVTVTQVGRRRVDGFGLLVLAELVASVVLTPASDDVRFVLARPAVYTAVAGVYALVT